MIYSISTIVCVDCVSFLVAFLRCLNLGKRSQFEGSTYATVVLYVVP